MTELPTPGPAPMAYLACKKLEGVVMSLRMTHLNVGITPHGAPELSTYLKALAGVLDSMSEGPVPAVRGRKK